ncbi:MAG: hypothetical protein ABIR91_00780 [Candidatus Saccharimonadales bacterium]
MSLSKITITDQCHGRRFDVSFTTGEKIRLFVAPGFPALSPLLFGIVTTRSSAGLRSALSKHFDANGVVSKHLAAVKNDISLLKRVDLRNLPNIPKLPFFVIRAALKWGYIKNVYDNAKAPVYAISARGDNTIMIGDQLEAYISTPISFPTRPLGTVAAIIEC